jgi:hypothetical protein
MRILSSLLLASLLFPCQIKEGYFKRIKQAAFDFDNESLEEF